MQNKFKNLITTIRPKLMKTHNKSFKTDSATAVRLNSIVRQERTRNM